MAGARCAAVLAVLGRAALARPPNILYILADDLGYGDVSWNNPDIHTPALQRLAEAGVVLDQFYAQPKCSPSRAALLTGIYPHKLSMQRGSIGDFRPTGLPTSVRTLPELLRQAGYSTHLVGKWHLGYCHRDYTPTRRGFDSFFGILSQQTDHYTREHMINKYMGSGYDLWRDEAVSREGAGRYSSWLWEAEVAALLTRLNTSAPWFIELAPTAAHAPFQAPDRYSKMYGDKNKQGEYSKEAVRRGMVTALDESVGRILERLRETGHHDNTLVVFASDNGAGLVSGNAPLRGKKGSIFEGGVRVPALVAGPPLAQQLSMRPGFVSSHLVHMVDWLPTLARLAGADPGPDIDGVDVWPLLTRDTRARAGLVLNIDLDDQSDTFQLGVRQGDYKLIWGQRREFKQHSKGARELLLFNLRRDPAETRNLAAEEPDKLAQLQQLARQLARGSRTAHHPNGLSLAYPRYHGGLLEPGWCAAPRWWRTLWAVPVDTSRLDTR